MNKAVQVFFMVAITAMTLKLFVSLIELTLSLKNADRRFNMDNGYHLTFEVLMIVDITADMSFSGLIMYYLSST